MIALNALRQEQAPILIFGAGFAGQVLLQHCREHGIPVAGFCDNNINKAGSTLLGCEVIHTSAMRERFPQALILISAADIGDVVLQLGELGYPRWQAGGTLLKGVEVANYPLEAPAEFLEYAVSTCILCHDGYLSPERIFLRSADIVITERCSLKCRDCANMMQYYVRPQNFGTPAILRTIDAFFSLIDEINELRVIGGEPFMNKQMHATLRRLTAEPKVKRVVIYTNGTLVPKGDNLEAMKHPKMLVLVTDYEGLSRKRDELAATLADNGIPFFVQAAQNWTHCSRIEPHHRSLEEQKSFFKNCCAKNLFTLMNGRFYRCPFSAHVDNLGAVPEFARDFIDLFAMEGVDSTQARSALRAFIYDLKYLDSCDYCAGRFLNDPEIPPAIQTAAPLPFIKVRQLT